MKIGSILGIAAAAVALSCLSITASASATVLCAKQESPCNSGPLQTGEKIAGALATGKNSVFENELGNITCTKSQLTAELRSPGSEEEGEEINPGARVSAWTQGSCTRANGGGGENCTVTEVNLGAAELEQWLVSFQSDSPWTGNGLYNLLWNIVGAPGYHVVCGKVIDCKFTGASGTPLNLTGGGPALIAVAAQLNVAGTTCPKNKPTWRGTWSLSAPRSGKVSTLNFLSGSGRRKREYSRAQVEVEGRARPSLT